MALADFAGTWLIDTPAKRDAMLAAANNRGQQCFDAMAAYGLGSFDPPLSLAGMLEVFILDADAVQSCLTHGGPRMYEFLTKMVEVA